jgi:heme O synthase-like polyprenyltransferase
LDFIRHYFPLDSSPFWALALMIKDDYAEVDIPMMPVVKGEEATSEQIWLYTLIVVPFTFLLIYPLVPVVWSMV